MSDHGAVSTAGWAGQAVLTGVEGFWINNHSDKKKNTRISKSTVSINQLHERNARKV